jgi:hypothetical protein
MERRGIFSDCEKHRDFDITGSVEKCRPAFAGATSRLRAEALRRASVQARSPLGRAHVLLRTLRPSKGLRPSLREASGQD